MIFDIETGILFITEYLQDSVCFNKTQAFRKQFYLIRKALGFESENGRQPQTIVEYIKEFCEMSTYKEGEEQIQEVTKKLNQAQLEV